MKTILLGYTDKDGKSSPKLLAGTEPQKQFIAAKSGTYPDGIIRIEMWDEDYGCKRRVAIKLNKPAVAEIKTESQQPKPTKKQSK